MKFAWSEPAARRVPHQIRVLEALAREPAVPFLPEVVASGTDALVLVTRRVRGSGVFQVAETIGRDRAGMQIARFPAALHGQEARRRVEAVTGAVPAYYPLVTTSALRERFGRWVTPWQQRKVMRWRDWADHRNAGEWVSDLASRFRSLGGQFTALPLPRLRRCPPGGGNPAAAPGLLAMARQATA